MVKKLIVFLMLVLAAFLTFQNHCSMIDAKLWQAARLPPVQYEREYTLVESKTFLLP